MGETFSCCISVYSDNEGKNFGLSRTVRITHDHQFKGVYFYDFQFPLNISVDRSKLEEEIDKIEEECEKSKYTVRIYTVSESNVGDLDKIVKKFERNGLKGHVNAIKTDKMISMIKKRESKEDNNIRGWRSGEHNIELQNMLLKPEINDAKYCSKIQGVYFLLKDNPQILKRIF